VGCSSSPAGVIEPAGLREEMIVAEADSKNEYGRTPLSSAARRGHEAVVRLLVERADVEADSKDDDGRTPLSRAAESGHEAVVKLLRSHNSQSS
jgi:ankyrin repeat protein